MGRFLFWLCEFGSRDVGVGGGCVVVFEFGNTGDWKRGVLFRYYFVLLGWRWRGGGVLLFD